MENSKCASVDVEKSSDVEKVSVVVHSMYEREELLLNKRDARALGRRLIELSHD